MASDKFVMLSADDVPEAPAPEPTKEPNPAMGHILNVALTILCFAATGAAGWFAHFLLSPPNFSEAQEALTSAGYADAADHLAEMGQVCANGKLARISCRLLIFDTNNSKTQISQASKVVVPK